MTPREIQDRIKALASRIGGRSHVTVYIGTENNGLPLYGTAYTNWPSSGPVFRLEAETWDELLDGLDRKWIEYHDEHNRSMVEKMAVEIIRITAQQGECTDAALRGWTFTAAQVETYGADACAKADEMAGNGPFEIVTLGKANAA